MSKIPTVTKHNTAFFKECRPVVLVAGGTSGIGQNMAYKIASYSKDPYIVIVGRSEQRGQETVEELQKLNSNGTYLFERCDMSVLDDIRDLVKRVSQKQPTFNLLVITSGGLSLKKRTNTVDGLDERMTLNYFGRFALINLMLPYLHAAAEEGHYVSVLSVLTAAQGHDFKPDDIGLDNSYGVLLAISQSSVCNDLMVEELSLRNPDVSFYHAHPGIVKTNVTARLPWYLRYPLELGVSPLFGISPTDSADYMLYGMTAAEKSTGWGLFGRYGDHVNPTKFQTPEGREKVWEYSTRATKTGTESS